MFTTPRSYTLSAVSRNKLLLANGQYCKWSGLPHSWKKRGTKKGVVRYFNRDLLTGIAVMATCPKKGEKRSLQTLAGELASSLDNREKLYDQEQDGMLWQRWKGYLNGDSVELFFAVTLKLGCVFDFTAIEKGHVANQAQLDLRGAVDGLECDEEWRWK